MKFSYNKKYATIALYSVISFCICMLLVFAALRYQGLITAFKKIFAVFTPVIWGVVLAYLLNPLLMFIERHMKKRVKHKKVLRLLSVTLTMLVTLAALAALVAIIMPQLMNSVLSIYNNMNNYFATIQGWVEDLNLNYPGLYDYLNIQVANLEDFVMSFIRRPELQNFFKNLTTGALNSFFTFLGGLWDFVLGLIVTVYLLASKEVFKAQIKKILYAMFSEKNCNNMLSIGKMADTTFIGFLSGKSLDSLIIGVLCFVALSIMKMPYPVLIAFIVGITNMIPFFGPFIGAVPSGLLILLSSPQKVLMFVIFIVVLQQFDGNILGPKILGNSTGLPAFWVMFSILVGGGLFGFVGMLIGVPVFAVIYTLTRQLINMRLRVKALPTDTEFYKAASSTRNFSWEEPQKTPPEDEEAANKLKQLSRKNAGHK